MKVVKEMKFLLLKIFKFFFRVFYSIITFIRPLDQDKVVIAVSRSSKLEGNLKYIYDELSIQKPEAKIHLIYSVNKMNLELFKELLVFSNAKYLIIDDYFLPIYLIKPKASLKVIQLWHAAGAFKKFGYSTIDKSFGPDKKYLDIVPIHSNYTHVYVSSENIVKHYTEAFNMSESQIYPLGIPRIDLFNDEIIREKTIQQIVNQYKLPINNKVIILFAPTYRANNSQKESDIDFLEILLSISNNISSDKVIVYKPHPYYMNESVEQLKKCKNIIVANNFSMNEWMLIADAFITDYSSAIFEYALLEKPIAHFVPDLNEYETRRGFYYPIKKISSGDFLENQDDLIVWINNRIKNEYLDTKEMVNFNFSNTKNNSKRITKHFLQV